MRIFYNSTSLRSCSLRFVNRLFSCKPQFAVDDTKNGPVRRRFTEIFTPGKHCRALTVKDSIELSPSEYFDIKPYFKDKYDAGMAKPVVIMFGWAGSKHQHINTYSIIYKEMGFDVVQLILPTHYIFENSCEVPSIVEHMLEQMDNSNLICKPTFIHSFSDTGLMCYQGLRKTEKESGRRLDIRGHIMDSCPGPVPHISIRRLLALILVRLACSRRDGEGIFGSTRTMYRLIVDRIYPNVLRHMRGLPASGVSYIDDVWSGNFVRNEVNPDCPELFLYSVNDFYLPYQYIEEQVIDRHKAMKRPVYTRRWVKSAHVGHLRYHRRDYYETVQRFVQTVYFDK